MASHLGDDLLLEILNKLPLKTLSRFTCVSTGWRHLIHAHCIRSNHPPLLSGVFHVTDHYHPRYGTLSSNGNFTASNLTPLHLHRNSRLVDSCNGLLLFFSWAPPTFHVSNPLNNTWVSLPMPRRQTLLSVLLFDPARSPHYKVISFASWRPQGAELEVYSSQTGKWADRAVHWAGLDNDSISTTMRYFNGALYVLAYPNQMVRVDVEEMTCRVIEMPGPTTHQGNMGLCAGHVYYADVEGEVVRIWVMVDGCKWVLKDRIGVPGVNSNLLGFNPEKEVLYMWVPGKILEYDIGRETERFEDVCELRGEMVGAYFIKIWVFPFTRFMKECLLDLE